ncbi:MAG: Crp/Fnr family transcriptional regulator [Chitinophagales bacterium]|nr:Crp/Fnr family transcriptional regulator [Chitinophagales bacterium]
MNRFNFTSYLTSNVKISDEFVEQLLQNCSIKLVKKNEFLLQQGNVCMHSFFVEQGLLRQFIIDEQGKEHIIQFAPENWFVADRSSQFFKAPAMTNIQAIEEAKLLMLDENIINQLIEKNPAYNIYSNQLLHKHIYSLQKRIYQLLASSAKERYLDFVKTYPDILLRVPQTMVASYLGITPESLSRVRKELAQEHML